MSDEPFDAVVLAGGRARRLGGVPKPTVVVGGGTLWDHALAATAGARRVVVVGPGSDVGGRPGVAHTQEDPPFGGPVAGLDAGLRALAAGSGLDPSLVPAPWVLVLAVDVPHAAAAVPRLRDAVTGVVDGAHLVRDGRDQWLVGLYRHDALRRALDALAAQEDSHGLHGLPVRRLVSRLEVVRVPDPDDLSVDVDTWEDVRRLTVGDHDGVTPDLPGTPPTERGGTR